MKNEKNIGGLDRVTGKEWYAANSGNNDLVIRIVAGSYIMPEADEKFGDFLDRIYKDALERGYDRKEAREMQSVADKDWCRVFW